ncbi:MAG: DUF418 domain-containing protein [Cyclobacteriaceae bacterium]|nr:DUF418 domain-containing protein [Cyclobacteriaceae bacterium]
MKLWLTYFENGSLEWLWRCLTYKTILPIKRNTLLNKV